MVILRSVLRSAIGPIQVGGGTERAALGLDAVRRDTVSIVYRSCACMEAQVGRPWLDSATAACGRGQRMLCHVCLAVFSGTAAERGRPCCAHRVLC